MRAVVLACFLALTVLCCSAKPQGRPIHFPPKGILATAAMLAPNVGWALSVPQPRGQGDASLLWWTTDGGERWREITPPTQVPEPIISVFFLDTRVGWALLDGTHQESDTLRFDLASTTSAGASWEVHRLSLPGPSTKGMESGYIPGLIAFADPLHGWLYQSPGLPALLITSDGGRTWQPAQAKELYNPQLVLVTPEVAWLTDTGSLYATRDGAKTWESVSLPPPSQLSKWIWEKSQPMYTAPVFHDPRHGFEVVTYGSSKSGALSTAVLFETLDGGVTWRAECLLGNLPANMNRPISSAVVDSTWLIARQPMYGLPMITILRIGEWEYGISEYAAGYSSTLQMSFISPARGWLVTDGALLSTQDGGASWTEVTPIQFKYPPQHLGDAQ